MHWCHCQCHQHHVMSMQLSIMSHDPKSHVAPHFDHLYLRECIGVTDDVISITWCWCQYQWHHMTKEVMLHLILIVLTYEMNGSTDNTIWHQITLVLLALHDPKVILHLISIVLPCKMHHVALTLAHMASHNQECHAVPLFNCLDLRNLVVPLLMLLAVGRGCHMTKRDMLQMISVVFT